MSTRKPTSKKSQSPGKAKKVTLTEVKQIIDDPNLAQKRDIYMNTLIDAFRKETAKGSSSSTPMPEVLAQQAFDQKIQSIMDQVTANPSNIRQKITAELDIGLTTIEKRASTFMSEHHRSISQGVDSANQVPLSRVKKQPQAQLVIAQQQGSMASVAQPVCNTTGAFFPPPQALALPTTPTTPTTPPGTPTSQAFPQTPPARTRPRAGSVPSSLYSALPPPPSTIGTQLIPPSLITFTPPVAPVVAPVVAPAVATAKASVKTSQGGGGQHAVMPHHVDEDAKFGVNMISGALRKTGGGGSAPPVFMDGGNGNGHHLPLPAPYQTPKPAGKKTKGSTLVSHALDRMLDPSIQSVISSQQPNAYRSEMVKDPSVVHVPKRMEILDDALFKQPRDPSNATEYGWFKMNDSYCEPAKIGTISCFEKYNADPGVVDLTGMLGNPNGISMDDRFVQNLNPVMFQDRSTQPNGMVDWTKCFLTGWGIG